MSCMNKQKQTSMSFLFLLSFLFMGMGNFARAEQNDVTKRPLTMDDVREWQRISSRFRQREVMRQA